MPQGAAILGQSVWGQLAADTRIDYVDIPLDYEIGLDITPGPTIIGDWAAIVHFTMTDTNCCDYGSRIPGVWFWPGTRKILVVDGHGANGNSHTGEWGCDDGILTLADGVKSRLTMVMTGATVHIYVDGALACDEPRADRRTHTGVSVYLADPWYAAADAVVGNLYLAGAGAAIAAPPPPPPAPPPPIAVSVPLGSQMLGGDGQLVADTQLADVAIPLDYEIGVTITPGSTIIGDWAAIVHFTATGTNCCDYGSRIPGVWFWPGTRKILVVDGHGANGNSHTGEWGCDDGILTLADGVTATLTMRMAPSTVNIYVNGDLACVDVPRADRQVWPAVNVFAADPWYAAADAVISDLYIYDPANLASTVDVVGGFAHQVFNGVDWWLVRRDHTETDGWHPVNDDLTGTAAAYGTFSTNPLADNTWSVQFDATPGYTDLLMASGDMTMWVSMSRAELASQCGSCSNCQMALTGSSGLGQPRQYCRAGSGEDPWISAGDHPDQIVYGEMSWTSHHVGQDGSVDALQAGGSNVWINAQPLDFLCPADQLMLDWTGGFHAAGHNVFDGYGGTHDAALTADALMQVADPLNGCIGDEATAGEASPTGLTNAAAMPGKIALIRRGVCYFTTKVMNAQNAGAIGAVIYNDDRAGTVVMSGPNVGITIPSIFILGTDGTALNAAITADPTIIVSIHCDGTTRYSGLPGATMLQDATIQLARDNELAPIDLPLDYTVGFTLTPRAYVGEWANIIHVSATGNNCCNYGDRIPGIWFYANTYRLHIRDGTTSSGNAGCDPSEELVVNVATAMRVEFRGFHISVFFDDVLKCEAARVDGRTTHTAARIWLPDNWHAPADANVDDVYILPLAPTGGCITRGACNFDTSASSDDGSCTMPAAGLDCQGNALFVAGVITMFPDLTVLVAQAEGSPLAVINLPLDYAVQFEFTPTAAAGGWANIIHFTADGGNCCAYGQRIPGVWFYGGTTRLHIRDGSTANGNDGCDPAEQLAIGATTTVRIQMVDGGVEVMYDGISKCTSAARTRASFNGIMVYACDPWHEVAAGSIQNLQVIAMDTGDTLVPGATYFTASPMLMVQGTELVAVDIPLDYDISFTIKPSANAGGWANIIHITADGGNCCGYGQRIPGIWFYGGGTRLHIRDGSTADGNDGCDPAEHLALNTDTTVLLEIRPTGIEVFYDTVSKCTGARGGRTEFPNARVFAPDPWHEAAQGTIDDFYLLPN